MGWITDSCLNGGQRPDRLVCFSAKFVKTFSSIEPRLVAVSIGRLEAQKRVESMDDDYR